MLKESETVLQMSLKIDSPWTLSKESQNYTINMSKLERVPFRKTSSCFEISFLYDVGPCYKPSAIFEKLLNKSLIGNHIAI
jgi:hypothetical protein